MKPQITIQDFAGQNNADLAKTQARLIKGGSWKRQRIIALIPAGETIAAKVCLSHWNLIFPPNNSMVRMLVQGMEVGEAYSTAIENILGHPELSQWEYVLTIEHDNMPPADGVLRLVERMEQHRELSAIGGLYFTKGEGGVAQIWGDPKDVVLNFRPQPPDPTGSLIECCGTGMGFTLFRLALFKDKNLRRPWFVTQTKEGLTSQDLYFWSDARKYGYRCGIDCGIKVGHFDQATDTVW